MTLSKKPERDCDSMEVRLYNRGWNAAIDAITPSPPPQRKPLPPEWINDCVREAGETTEPDSDFACFEWFVRKVEAAHGIKENT